MTTPEQERQLRALWAKAVNAPRGGEMDDLAARLAASAMRSADVVSSRDTQVVRAVVRAIAPYIKELEDEIAELRARLDEITP